MGMLESLEDILLVVTVSLVVIFVLGGAFIYFKMNKKEENNEPEKVAKKVDPNIAKEKIASFLPYDSLEDNMIMMDKGDKFVMLIGGNGINYYLMSDVEKESVEGCFIQVLNSLRFPIQIYVQTTSVNLDNSIKLYEDREKAMEENLVARAQDLQFAIRERSATREELDAKRLEIQKFRNVYEYTHDLITNTKNITLNQWIIKKNYYIVIPYYLSESGMINRFSEDEMKKIARQELETRATSIIDGLSNIGIDAHIVDSNELRQVIYSSLNRDDAGIFTFEKAQSADFDALFKTTEKAHEEMTAEKNSMSNDLFNFNY